MNDVKLKLVEIHTLHSLEDTARLALVIANQLNDKQIIGLQGPMGSGKTHFVKALALQLFLPLSGVNSPSYALHQQYQGPQLTLHHWDLFRLESEEEIESSGFWDLFYEDKVIIAIEWVDRLSEKMLPQNFSYLRLDWEMLGKDLRRVSIWKRQE